MAAEAEEAVEAEAVTVAATETEGLASWVAAVATARVRVAVAAMPLAMVERAEETAEGAAAEADVVEAVASEQK